MQNSDNTLFTAFLYKYLPFWSLFVVLLTSAIIGTWGYIYFISTPMYEISASLIIKDEKKGVNDSKMTESIDAFTSSKIVENEINVLHSRTLMSRVVKKLRLYVPIYEEGRFKSSSAYTTSPIVIRVKNPDEAKEYDKVYFDYDYSSKRIKINDKTYQLNKWVKTPYGELRFLFNKNQTNPAKHPLYFSIVRPKKVVNQLLSRITIQASSKVSTVVDLILKDDVPKRGEDILNHLINSYNEVEITERTGIASSTLEFVEDRIKLVEKELEDLENKLVQYKATKGGVNLGEQGKLYLENVGNNDRKISEINSQLAVLNQVEQYIISKENTEGIVPSTSDVNDPVLTQLLQKLHNSESEYNKLRSTTAENNPVLVSLTGEIENIRPRILENINNQRVNLEAKRANLYVTNRKYNAALQDIPQKERELLEISRQQSIKNNAYNFLLQKREEAILSYAPTVGDSRIIDRAESTSSPVSPRKAHLYILAIAMALTSGVAIIKAKELLSSKLLFRSEIADSVSAPIVAELTIMKHQKGSLFNEPTEASVVEQFRKLRITMGLYGRSMIKKKIMVTSSIPGEGKSFVSSNLAYSLASSGNKVVLVDFDLRNPNASVLFNVYKQEGMIEYLLKEVQPDNIIKETSFPNLSIIPAGINIGDHTDSISKRKYISLFSYLETTFDFIIIDTPPVDLVSDSFLLSENCDITLLVMRHAYTPKSLVQNLATNDVLSSLKNVAIIFNGVKPRGFVKGQYGYGYGYGNERKYGDRIYQTRNYS